MENAISLAKASYDRARARITRALETTPDDRISWSPAPTARTPLEQVAHAAMAVKGLQDMMCGVPFPWASIEEADKVWRAEEKKYGTREQALELLAQVSTGYFAWLDGLTQEQIDSTLHMPFGTFPLGAAITFPADHMHGHAAQIDYIQTVYGDLSWHMPTG